MLNGTALEALNQRPIPFLRSAWPWRSVAYLLAGTALGLVAVALVVVSAAAATAAAVAVAVVLVATAPLLGRFERWRLRLVDRVPLPVTPGRGRREAVLGAVTMLALWWIDLVMLAVTIGGPTVLVLSPVVQPTGNAVATTAASVAGVLLLPVAAYTVTAWAGARAGMVRAILAPESSELREVKRSRARLVDAFELERRRIERDLHDGAQQRLVALTMSLGMAKLDLPADAPVARLVGLAHDEAKQALAELRELIRGVHPQVLTDRGLPAAVRDLAGRSPVPVDVDLPLAVRLPASVEVTAYYVVSEALANVAKHSQAGRATVSGRAAGETLLLEIHDDGRGGADPAGGTGLTGLADRLAAVGGRLSLSSPAGGPTRVRVEIPCAW
ncbi:sensor histidine kinase [Nonomuraea muscovyensis]|uniref:histidine kinase n=1 Tax=Nonomuraea muscovyensis TaxID=1124761 RepID=A0A7X0C217_9ACTN|nr:histidine kinase [Nonomuraea muscovyensis]MBB6346261.1 signal transduction histidine kinase [Nonomuraea muscovyensis]